MSGLKFVNIYGEPVSLAPTMPPPKAAKGGKSLKRVTDIKKATHHFGFEIVGVSATDLKDARDKALSKMRDFDQAAWIAQAKTRRVFSRRFTLADSAEQAAEILRRDPSWVAVAVRPVLKG